MCGWSTAAAALDSRMKRCRNASSLASSGARIFSATRRSKPGIAGAEDDRHAAAADLLLEPVAGYLRAHGKPAYAAGFSSLTAPSSGCPVRPVPARRPATGAAGADHPGQPRIAGVVPVSVRPTGGCKARRRGALPARSSFDLAAVLHDRIGRRAVPTPSGAMHTPPGPLQLGQARVKYGIRFSSRGVLSTVRSCGFVSHAGPGGPGLPARCTADRVTLDGEGSPRQFFFAPNPSTVIR